MRWKYGTHPRFRSKRSTGGISFIGSMQPRAGKLKKKNKYRISLLFLSVNTYNVIHWSCFVWTTCVIYTTTMKKTCCWLFLRRTKTKHIYTSKKENDEADMTNKYRGHDWDGYKNEFADGAYTCVFTFNIQTYTLL